MPETDYHDLSATHTVEPIDPNREPKKYRENKDWTKAFQPPVLIDPTKDRIPSVQEAIGMLFEGSTASMNPDIAGYIGGLTEAGENVLIKAYGDESLSQYREFYDREHKRVGWFDYTVVPLVETLVKRRIQQLTPQAPPEPGQWEKRSIKIEGCGHLSHIKNTIGLSFIYCYPCGVKRPITASMRKAIFAIEAHIARDGN